MSRLLSTALLLWAFGFILFALTLPRLAGSARTDGVVVLTGGPGRLQRGLQVLAAGDARRLLISGVDRRVKPEELAATYRIPPALRGRIDLGTESVDTRSNADEAAEWVAREKYRSIRLVTTDWHMRRARLEVGRMMPRTVRVVPDAIRSEPGLLVLLREYNKYLLRLGASVVGM